MKKNTCSIVVDASIARAAGTTDAPTSSNCRDFLFGLRDATQCHCVFSPELRDEWKKHASVLSAKWQNSMLSRRRVTHLPAAKNDQLQAHLNKCAGTISGQADIALKLKVSTALAKDAHLVEAAIQAGNRVASLDEALRSYLQVCARTHANLKRIAWVNPNNADEQASDWIQAGAPLDRHRKLGHQP
jgi:cytochrome c553